MQIQRQKELDVLSRRLKGNPVVAILGPRQCGKTTLARQFSSLQTGPVHFFDLEDPRDLARLENPMLSLEPLQGLVVIDEIQRRPELFSVLRVLADQNAKRKYLILGSASRDLIRQSLETLAGRISYLELGGLTLSDIPAASIDRLWMRGGFPRSYLAADDETSLQWRRDYILTFLERDIPNLGINIPAAMLRRFWEMTAHYHGNIFNASEIARSLSVSDQTARRYLDILSMTFVVRQVQPWFYNTKKRLIKRPKIYIRDSGLFHALMGFENRMDVDRSPKLGASWEGFAIEQVIRHLNLLDEEVFFWGIHSGAECDLVFKRHGRLWGVEVKYSEAPASTPSMNAALRELNMKHLWVVHPGKDSYPLSKQITTLALKDLSVLNIKD